MPEISAGHRNQSPIPAIRWYLPPYPGGFFTSEVAMKLPRFRRKEDVLALALLFGATLAVTLAGGVLYVALPVWRSLV